MRMFDVTEPASPKPGHGGLKLLEALGGSASEAERTVGGSSVSHNINTFTNTIIVCR